MLLIFIALIKLNVIEIDHHTTNGHNHTLSAHAPDDGHDHSQTKQVCEDAHDHSSDKK